MGPKTGCKNNTYLLYAQYLLENFLFYNFLYSRKKYKMHKTTYLLLFLLSLNFNLSAQINSRDNNFIDNVRFGGGFNIGFGNSYSTFSISPSAIYDFSNEFGAGLGFTYVYVKNKSVVQSTTNLVGGSLLAFYKPVYNIQLSTEYEQLKVSRKYGFSNEASSWQPALYIGLEYVSGNMAVGLRYDILFDEATNIIYSSALTPVFRIYF
jgi:hypothetical protein